MRKINMKRIVWILACLHFAGVILASQIYEASLVPKAENDTGNDASNAAYLSGMKSPGAISGITQTIDRSGERIEWIVFSNGIVNCSSTDLHLMGTMAQPTIGKSSSIDHEINSGYWQSFILNCDCQPGECDGIEPINILDIVYLINYIYKSGPEPCNPPK